MTAHLSLRLVLLSVLTMTAFAANSVLNRLAVDSGAIAPADFALIRVLSGAAILILLVRLRGGALPLRGSKRLLGAGALTLYMVGFSAAYLSLGAGPGALILFGVVQITMFSITAARGGPVGAMQVLGAVLAFVGLAWVLWPAEGEPVRLAGAALMASAGIGWAVYTLVGRSETDALAATAANFCLALPLTALAALVLGDVRDVQLSGVALAVLSGAVTSGLGYALWYRILPQLAATTAATVQLSVPVIALAGGALLLGEPVPSRLMLGAVLVLGGIALAVLARPRP